MDAKTKRIHEVLDGEARGDASLAPEVAAYRRTLDRLPTMRAAPPSDLEARIMERLPAAMPRRGLRARLVALWPGDGRWWAPALAGALAALGVVALVRPLLAPVAPPPNVAALSLPASSATAQFELFAPTAHTVELIGDFTEWKSGRILLEGPDASGHWTATVELPRGRHEYFFLLDGETWRSDPNALAYRPDGFGQNNAIIEL